MSRLAQIGRTGKPIDASFVCLFCCYLYINYEFFTHCLVRPMIHPRDSYLFKMFTHCWWNLTPHFSSQIDLLVEQLSSPFLSINSINCFALFTYGCVHWPWRWSCLPDISPGIVEAILLSWETVSLELNLCEFLVGGTTSGTKRISLWVLIVVLFLRTRWPFPDKSLERFFWHICKVM